MQNIKKVILICVAVLLLVVTVTGCNMDSVKEALNFHSSASLTLDIATGDKIKAELDTSNGLSMRLNKDTSHLEIKNKEKELVFECAFMPKDALEEYAANAENQLKIYDAHKENGMAYTLCSYEDKNGDKVYEIIGWIVGTNTGILADGTDSKSEILNVLKSLQFSCEETDQKDDDFFPEFVLIED